MSSSAVESLPGGDNWAFSGLHESKAPKVLLAFSEFFEPLFDGIAWIAKNKMSGFGLESLEGRCRLISASFSKWGSLMDPIIAIQDLASLVFGKKEKPVDWMQGLKTPEERVADELSERSSILDRILKYLKAIRFFKLDERVSLACCSNFFKLSCRIIKPLTAILLLQGLFCSTLKADWISVAECVSWLVCLALSYIGLSASAPLVIAWSLAAGTFGLINALEIPEKLRGRGKALEQQSALT